MLTRTFVLRGSIAFGDTVWRSCFGTRRACGLNLNSGGMGGLVVVFIKLILVCFCNVSMDDADAGFANRKGYKQQPPLPGKPDNRIAVFLFGVALIEEFHPPLIPK